MLTRVMDRSFDPQLRGYHAAYQEGDVNNCPGCGRTHWIIGRVSAECAFCATALPLSSARHQMLGRSSYPPPGSARPKPVSTSMSRGPGLGPVRKGDDE